MGRGLEIVTLGLMLGVGSIVSADPGLRSAVNAPPDSPDPSGHYLFYLHGAIVETGGREPRHPRFGVYEYDSILRALGGSRALVISEQRPAGTVIDGYAGRVIAQVKHLLEHGVEASRIAIVGFSKGGAIAQVVSSKLDNPELSYVLLGACPAPAHPGPAMHGRVFSIRERSDSVPSCRALFKRWKLPEAKEIEIAIGGQHGAFYRVHTEWLTPLFEFVHWDIVR
jgi:hypothetical protein